MTFLIDYQLLNSDRIVKSGTIKVKNKQNELEAKIKLEEYLKKNNSFDRMIITKCEEDFLSTWNSLFGNFNSNPFSKF